MYTLCECHQPGFCTRHQCEKAPHFWKLCQTRQDYYQLYEDPERLGPGQTTEHKAKMAKRGHWTGQVPTPTFRQSIVQDAPGQAIIATRTAVCAFLGPIISKTDSDNVVCNCPKKWLRKCEIYAECALEDPTRAHSCKTCPKYSIDGEEPPDVQPVTVQPSVQVASVTPVPVATAPETVSAVAITPIAPITDPPAATAIHEADHAGLRHRRDSRHGFVVGKYRQPPPMIFTRDGHNVWLGDMYRGFPCFLLCAGPSLTANDLKLLQRPGILTMAVNNAAAVFRPQLWVSVDDPSHFVDMIWYDPGITKFVPLCHMEKKFKVRDVAGALIDAPHVVGDMPAVFGYRRNENFQPDQWLYEDSFNWGNHKDIPDQDGHTGGRSIFYIALKLLYYLGVRRVFLMGCDFHMQDGVHNYAFPQDRSRSSVRNNNTTYGLINSRLGLVLSHFAHEDFRVFNCTPGSSLQIFPQVAYSDAIRAALEYIPEQVLTQGMYDQPKPAG